MSNKYIKTFSTTYFTKDQSSFFIRSLDGIGAKYPLLEDCFRANANMILFIESGCYTIRLNESTFIDSRAQVYFINRGDIAQVNVGADCVGSFICFEDSFFSQRYHENVLGYFNFYQLGGVNHIPMCDLILNKVKMLLGLMLSEYAVQRFFSVKVLRSYLNIILCELQLSDHVSNRQDLLNNNLAKDSRVLLFLELVEHHFREAKTPSFYAKKLCITPNYLNKLCKQERGLTAGQIVRQRVLVEAKRLLQFSDSNINEIARNLGFDTTSYFVTFFKNQEGVTPEVYRKTCL